MRITKERLESLRKQYPVGSRVRLIEMKDPYAPVEPGTMGSVTGVDDAGTVHCTWDNGRGLGLIPGEDSFRVLPPDLHKEQSIQVGESHPAAKLAEGLPELCFTTLPGSGALVCLKRGESGYYPSDWDTGDRVKNRELADYNNHRLGVTPEQRKAMECGSMHGWNIPGADPKFYVQDAPQMGGMTLE